MSGSWGCRLPVAGGKPLRFTNFLYRYSYSRVQVYCNTGRSYVHVYVLEYTWMYRCTRPGTCTRTGSPRVHGVLVCIHHCSGQQPLLLQHCSHTCSSSTRVLESVVYYRYCCWCQMPASANNTESLVASATSNVNDANANET